MLFTFKDQIKMKTANPGLENIHLKINIRPLDRSDSIFDKYSSLEILLTQMISELLVLNLSCNSFRYKLFEVGLHFCNSLTRA